MTAILRIFDYLYLPALFIAALYLLQYGPELPSDDIEKLPLILATVLLFAGFSLRGLYWHIFLQRLNINIPFTASMASQLKPVLLKFIPGKIFSFAGRTAILVEHGCPIKHSITAAFLSQLLNVVVGLGMGAIGVLIYGITPLMIVAVIYLVFFMILVIKSVRSIRIPERFRFISWGRIHVELPGHAPPFLDLILLSFICWLLIGAAFWIFILCTGIDIGSIPVFMQPAANSIGILAVVAPSGIGVREAATVAYLSWAGITVQTAVSVAILARFWTVAVELLTTFMGTVCHYHSRRQRRPLSK